MNEVILIKTESFVNLLKVQVIQSFKLQEGHKGLIKAIHMKIFCFHMQINQIAS